MLNFYLTDVDIPMSELRQGGAKYARSAIFSAMRKKAHEGLVRMCEPVRFHIPPEGEIPGLWDEMETHINDGDELRVADPFLKAEYRNEVTLKLPEGYWLYNLSGLNQPGVHGIRPVDKKTDEAIRSLVTDDENVVMEDMTIFELQKRAKELAIIAAKEGMAHVFFFHDYPLYQAMVMDSLVRLGITPHTHS